MRSPVGQLGISWTGLFVLLVEELPRVDLVAGRFEDGVADGIEEAELGKLPYELFRLEDKV